MFLRKLMVMALPLLLTAALALGFSGVREGAITGSDFWGNALFGLLCGLALSLLPMAAGASRKRVPFARLLWVPAALLTALVLMQGFGAGFLPPALWIYKNTALHTETAMVGALIGTALLG